jgi:hypothetical protein
MQSQVHMPHREIAMFHKPLIYHYIKQAKLVVSMQSQYMIREITNRKLRNARDEKISHCPVQSSIGEGCSSKLVNLPWVCGCGRHLQILDFINAADGNHLMIHNAKR